MTNIPHSRPTLGDQETTLVQQVIQKQMIAQGREVQSFEKAFADKMGVKHAAAVSSGTAALHLTLLAIGIKPGDEVIIPSYVCTALLNAIHYTGATPILADIEKDSYNIDPIDVQARITTNTKALIVPHLFGRPADINSLLKLNIPIIEDCAQATGGRFDGRPLGSFGEAAIFSFYATKVMTTGEGGMVISNSQPLVEQVKALREYDNQSSYTIRYNYKMTDIQAAMGIAQLEKLDEFIRRRKEIASVYFDALSPYRRILPRHHPDHIYFRYVLNLPEAEGLPKALQADGIAAEKPVYRPLHNYLDLTGYPRSDKAWTQALSIPIYPSLTRQEVERIIHTLSVVRSPR